MRVRQDDRPSLGFVPHSDAAESRPQVDSDDGLKRLCGCAYRHFLHGLLHLVRGPGPVASEGGHGSNLQGGQSNDGLCGSELVTIYAIAWRMETRDLGVYACSIPLANKFMRFLSEFNFAGFVLRKHNSDTTK